MKLCVLTTSYPRSNTDDAGIFVARLTSALQTVGVSGFVVVPQDKDESPIETRGSFEVHRYRYGLFTQGSLAFGSGIMPNIRRHPWLCLQIPAFLTAMALKAISLRNSFDLIHANWISAGVVAWVCHLLTGKRYAITLRGEDVKLVKNKLLRPLINSVFARAFAITTVNKEFLDYIKNSFGVAVNKLHCIENGVDVEHCSENETKAFAQKHNLSLSQKYLVYTGRVIPLKRIEILIELVSTQQMHDYHLLVCGPCEDLIYLHQLEKLVNEKSCRERVHFLGRVSPCDIKFCLKLGRFYVSASSYEGRSNSILEALANGLPVLASDIPGHRELIRDQENGILFSPDFLSSLMKQVEKLENEPELYNLFKKNGLLSVASLTWENCAHKYLSVFELA